jgi:hypothetical protein
MGPNAFFSFNQFNNMTIFFPLHHFSAFPTPLLPGLKIGMLANARTATNPTTGPL